MTIMNSSRTIQLTMNKTRTDLQCTVCREHRATLRPRKSKLQPSMQMWLCNECFEEKREPRFLIILVARDKKNGGLEKVRDYIRNQRYHGPKITAEELV